MKLLSHKGYVPAGLNKDLSNEWMRHFSSIMLSNVARKPMHLDHQLLPFGNSFLVSVGFEHNGKH